MIKIRVIRKSTDITVHPATVSTTVLWIGCIASELARAFPVRNGSEHDQLAGCHFEGFANGVWLRISDPRTERIPTSESELRNSYRGPCKHRHTAGRDL